MSIQLVDAVDAMLNAGESVLPREYGGSYIGAATYAQLRAYTGDATRIQIGGRDNYFDGCSGIAVRTGSKPDNDGTVWVDALGRSWEREFSGPVEVRWFGATGAGGDYTTEIRNAIAASVGKTLSFHDGGDFRCGQNDLPSNIRIEVGSLTTISLITAPSNFTIFYVYQKENVSISGRGNSVLRMTKADYSGESNHGINIDASSNISVDNLFVEGCGGDGVYVGGSPSSTACNNIRITNVIAENNRRNGISVTFAKNVVIDSCVLRNQSGALPEAGIDLEPNVGTTVEDVKVGNSFAYGNRDGFISALGPKRATFTNCTAYGNSNTGFSVISSSGAPIARVPEDNKLIACLAYSNGSTGMYIYYASGTQIIGGSSLNNSGFGVQVQGAPQTSLDVVDVKGNASRGVAVTDIAGGFINGCTITDNAAGGIVMTGSNSGLRVTGNALIGNYDLAGTYNTNLRVLASDSVIANNYIRKGTGTNKPDYGIDYIAGSTGLTVYGNDTTGGGLVSDTRGATAAMFAAFSTEGFIRCGNGSSDKGGFELPYNPAQAASRTWRIKNDTLAFGDFAIQQATTAGGSTFTTILTAAASGGHVAPGSDNTQTLGTSSKRWSVVYAGTGTINTSDGREKQDISDLTEAEKRVALALKGMIKKFRFKDAVQQKGEDARIHVGVIAQEVIAAFEVEGLDPMRYAIVCYDEWEEQREVIDDEGNVTVEYRPAGNRYGIRYEELLAFIISVL